MMLSNSMRPSTSSRRGGVRLALRLAQCVVVMAALVSPGRAASHGVSACASCHRAQTDFQPQSQMARALEIARNNSVLESRDRLTFAQAGYTWTVSTRDGRSIYSVTDGSQTISVPIVWGFGAGNQTWVLERDGHFYESLVSYYPTIHGLDITTGDATIHPHTLEQAFGRRLDPTDARTCFGCHASNDVVDGKLDLTAIHPGISCAHCHGETLQHLNSMLSGDLTVYPTDLSRMDAEDISDFCGRCHRSFETVVRSHWHGEATVRFQPYRLELSACFNGADSRISCVACHDPHKPLVTRLSWYDAKCLACHTLNPHARSITDAQADRASHSIAAEIAAASASPQHASAAPAAAEKVTAMAPAALASSRPRSCPVATSHCIACHMPLTQMLGGHLWFYDHYIRVARPGQPYPD